MASFEAHVEQAKKNLLFLSQVTETNNYEWQVTVCFYVAVHLINAHIAKKADQHFRSHGQVDQAINSKNPMSVSKLNDDQYIAYNKLHNLSRRARYLIHEDATISSTCLTYSVHLEKALKNLEILMSFINNSYKIEFDKHDIKCIELKQKKHSSLFFVFN